MATKKGTGDLLATVEVAVPQKLSAAERKAVEALAAAGVWPDDLTPLALDRNELFAILVDLQQRQPAAEHPPHASVRADLPRRGPRQPPAPPGRKEPHP